MFHQIKPSRDAQRGPGSSRSLVFPECHDHKDLYFMIAIGSLGKPALLLEHRVR